MTVLPAARRRARHYAMQALYQWQMTGASINIIEAEFHTDNDMSKVDIDYFRELLHSVPRQLSDLDATYSPYLQGRTAAELDPITQALLRLAVFELKHRPDVSYRIVINEAVALAKKFGATDSHKFINGVLDRTASIVRAVEVKAAKR